MSQKKGSNLFRNKGLWIVLLLALSAVIVLIIGSLRNASRTAKRSLTVYLDGEEYISSPLIPGETITVHQDDGKENVIRMTENGFFMESASCPNQECIGQGEVTIDNWKSRKLLEQVICLPNRVTVSLDLVDNNEGIDMDLPDM